ncbi:CobW family GTP-binding protein [Brevibacterium yomogidense]|uniref:CobW family GTP-binding protein n=1 Tax=Brevibacterium yomogidense TaxID=946573 RepID=UPI0018E01211|nr:GTP-binding protein [Brevibacterium yomogidense]
MGASAAVAKPLTLVSGYLGTGKTTLINHVLASGALGRAAVVVNDFGSVNIDAALIRASGADTVELTNGCICCQITDDVQRTMTALAARDDLDHVVCEVSGIGNPAQLGAWRTYPGFRPGGVVVCVDAGVTLNRLRDEFVSDIVHAQIRAADLLVVTKADSVSDSLLTKVWETCAQIAGDVPVEVVRDESNDAARSGGAWEPVLRGLVELSSGRADGRADGLAGGPADGHASAHTSMTVDLQEPVDVDRVVQVLDAHADDLVRAKGVVRAADGTRVVVQLAGGVVTSRPGPEVPAGSGGTTTPAVPAEPDGASARSSLVLIAAGPHAQQALHRAAQDLGAQTDA